MKVHKGDTVLVIAGKDKGAKGKVLQAFPDRNRVLVEGVNAIKKHTPISTTFRSAIVGRGTSFRAPVTVRVLHSRIPVVPFPDAYPQGQEPR